MLHVVVIRPSCGRTSTLFGFVLHLAPFSTRLSVQLLSLDRTSRYRSTSTSTLLLSAALAPRCPSSLRSMESCVTSLSPTGPLASPTMSVGGRCVIKKLLDSWSHCCIGVITSLVKTSSSAPIISRCSGSSTTNIAMDLASKSGPSRYNTTSLIFVMSLGRSITLATSFHDQLLSPQLPRRALRCRLLRSLRRPQGLRGLRGRRPGAMGSFMTTPSLLILRTHRFFTRSRPLTSTSVLASSVACFQLHGGAQLRALQHLPSTRPRCRTSLILPTFR